MMRRIMRYPHSAVASCSQSQKKRGAITVAEIAIQFAVSPDTIRRDLDYLAERGLIRRTHGGAVPLDHVTVRDMPVIQRL
jgi:DeoR/GlpR family transcriptional regulator of sugar metabolism